MGSISNDCDTTTAITDQVVEGAVVKVLTLSPRFQGICG